MDKVCLIVAMTINTNTTHTGRMPFLSQRLLASKNFIELLLDPLESSLRAKVFSWVIVFSAYLLTAQIGVYLYRDIGTSPALVWPPVGIAIAAVLIEGYWISSAIALAALCSALLSPTDPPFFIIFGLVFANTVQALAGGYILRKLRFNPLMNSLKDVFLLSSVALIATSIMPLLNFVFALSYNYLFAAERALPAWPTIWLGSALSALILTPVLSRWAGGDFHLRTKFQQFEALASIMTVVGVSYLLFVTPFSSFFGTSMLLMLIGALFWTAFRVGPRIMSLSLLLMTAISIIGALYGIRTPSSANQTLAQRLISTEMFDLIISFFFFILVSVEEQRKEAMRALSEDAARLSHALETIRKEDKAKNEFIATLAHELRNPLAPIISGLELLILEEKDTGKLEILDSAQRQSQVMRRLLDELLDVARIAKRSFVLKKEHVDLHAVLQESLKAVAYFMRERNHNLKTTLSDAPAIIHGDSVRLSQIFTNILFNAAKYTEPGGTIQVSLERSGNSALIRISDTGIGIEKQMLDTIFEPFVQSGRTTSIGSGLGIGLSIAKQLTELHGGEVFAESDGKNTGSVFTVTLPLVPYAKPNDAVSPSPSNKPMSILVVDDNKDAANTMAKLLRARGHTVETAYSGQDALDSARRGPHAILLDIGLPDMDGVEVAKRIRQKNKDMRIIALSGYGFEADKKRAYEAGVALHVTKPASLSDIEASLAQ